MTILDTLPPLRTRGAIRVSDTPLDDLALDCRLLLDAPATGRCPALLPGPALGSLRQGWGPAPALAALDHGDAAVLADRYPTGCLFHPGCLAPFGGTFPGLAPVTTGTALLAPAENPRWSFSWG